MSDRAREDGSGGDAMTGPGGVRVGHEDWLRVHEVLQEYADAIDHGDIPRILSVFTPDALWDYAPGQARRGHAGIRAFFEERMQKFARTSHNVCPPVVRAGPTPGTFRSRAYFQGQHQLGDGGRYGAWGRYVDLLVPADGGGLLIAERRVVIHVLEGIERVNNTLTRASKPDIGA